jgi:hypothetical protein
MEDGMQYIMSDRANTILSQQILNDIAPGMFVESE